MGIIDYVREKFRGKEAWESCNKIIFFTVYGMFFIVMRFIPQYFWIIMVAISFVLLIYGNLYQRKLREVAESRKGSKSVEGWTTHGYKLGEKHFYDPLRFEVKDKLSPAALKDIQDFIDIEAENGKALKTKTGLERFRQKQISYKETVKGEEMDDMERLKLKKEELKGYKKSMDEYEDMIRQELSKRTIQKNKTTGKK